MKQYEAKLRETARKLLEEKKVDVVVGYKRGTLPLKATPVFVRDPAKADELILDPTCSLTLATYLPKLPGKKAIVARGCDARAVNVYIQERQLERESVFVIGVPCLGVIDRDKVAMKLGRRDLSGVREWSLDDQAIKLKGRDVDVEIPVKDVLHDDCLACDYAAPPIFDVMLDDNDKGKGETQEPEGYRKLREMTPEQRWEYFKKETAKCIRCYACRQVCPVCYCPTCFVDDSMPKWIGRSDRLTDTQIFHITRAMHVAGRCIGCGACTRACPMDIDVRMLFREIEKDVEDMYEHVAGKSPDQAPFYDTYKENDPQEFIY